MNVASLSEVYREALMLLTVSVLALGIAGALRDLIWAWIVRRLIDTLRQAGFDDILITGPEDWQVRANKSQGSRKKNTDMQGSRSHCSRQVLGSILRLLCFVLHGRRHTK